MDYRVYCGVDFHARQQTISSLTTEDGVVSTHELKHQNKAELKAFYAQFRGPVLVALEASGYSPWFEQMLEELGHEVWLGDAIEIRRRARRRQKNDRRDAELILDLLLHNEFPRIHRPSVKSREILRMLRYRHKLVQMRTIVKNSLHALSIQSGLSLRAKLFTGAGLDQLRSLTMSPVMQYQRDQWLVALASLDQQIIAATNWLGQQAVGDTRVQRLRTHPGIGLLTGLAVVHTLEPVIRFRNQRKVAAYVGFDPQELGSASQLVEVPALAANRIALSGITLSTESADSPRGERVANSIANLAMRRFHSSSNLFYSYVVYVGRARKSTEAPALLAEVRLFRDGALVYGGDAKAIDMSGQSDVERITAAGGLRLNSLAPGTYVLQVKVKEPSGKGGDAMQLIDFEVVPWGE